MARVVVDTWSQDALANDDDERAATLAMRTKQMVDDESNDQDIHGYVCMMIQTQVTAVACLIAPNDTQTLVRLAWIETHHSHIMSGTALLISLKSAHDGLQLDHDTLGDRWLLEYMYLSDDGSS